MKTAFLFPGQGAQFVGMGKELYDTNPTAHKLYEQANEILGFNLAQFCFTGPDTELNKTNICQPAILVTSLTTLAAWKEGKEQTDNFYSAAGLSLGEYTALVASGAISFEDAVRIVERRGTFMQEACDKHPGGMLSIIGLDRTKVEEICKLISARDGSASGGQGVVGIANLNSPGQIVISGDETALKESAGKLKDAGAKRVIPLKVAGAFHSPLMKSAEDKLKVELDKIKINPVTKPVVSNVTADYARTPEQIKECLAKQVTNPVLWEDSIKRLIKDGVQEFYEIGPGNILSRLLQRIDSNTACHKI